VDEGSAIALSLTSPSDPSAQDTQAGFTYAFDCGSGYGAFSDDANALCPTSDNGTRNIGAKVRDKDGSYTEYAKVVTVKNVAPTATFNTTDVDEGSPIVLSVTGASDPSQEDTAAGFTYAFDCGQGFGDYGAGASTTCATSDSGVLNVGARIRDKDGGVSEYSKAVTVNNVAPTATFSAPASAIQGTAYSLSMSQPSDPSSADTSAGFTYAFDCGAGYGPATVAATASCNAPDKPSVTVRGKAIDKDGGYSEYSRTVAVTNVEPSGTVKINGGATYTRSAAVTLTLSATDPAPGSGVSSMRFRNGGMTTWSPWEPYATSKAWTLTSGNGTKAVYVQYKDRAGNIVTKSDSIFLDSVKPTGRISINGGAASTSTQTVKLTLSATDPAPASGMYQMRFRNHGTSTWSTWQAYGTSKSWTLTSGAGTKTVYVQYKDKAGNIVQAQDSITYSP
jgi:hypothetical protein